MRLDSEVEEEPFFYESIDYLGHVTAPGKLQVARKTTKAIADTLSDNNLQNENTPGSV